MIKSFFRASEHTLPVVVMTAIQNQLSSDDANEFNELLDQFKQELNSLLGENGVIIYPGFPTSAPFHNQALFTNPVDWIVYFGIFNAIGLPSTQVCMGLDSNRLPVGIQLVANRYCDNLTIRLAELLEREFGGWIEP